VIPIELELEKGNPVAAVRVNGIPLHLIIDSGGEYIALKPQAFRKVPLAPAGKTVPGMNALGESRPQSIFNLATLEMGGGTFRNLEATEAGAYAEGAAGDGVIGRVFLNRHIAVYDYAAKTITLFSFRERRAAEQLCRGVAVPTIPDPEGIIVSAAKTDHATMRLGWDTGAVYSFVKKTFAEEQQLPIEVPFYNSRRFEMSGQDFGPQQFVAIDALAPASIDGFIGYNFFMSHVVCIDPQKKVVRVRPRSASAN